MKYSDYKKLEVWNISMNFVKNLYDLTKFFPEEEKFGLTQQIRRAGVSIPSNIAEGHARNSKKEFVHFLFISKGSSAEVETQLILANKLGYIEDSVCDNFVQELTRISKMLASLINYLSSNK